MKSQALHYREQRDKLAYYLLEILGLSKVKVAEILGITPQAVSTQFPNRNGGDQ